MMKKRKQTAKRISKRKAVSKKAQAKRRKAVRIAVLPG
jgi:hypothetical protein